MSSKVQVASIGRNGGPHLRTLLYGLLEGRIAFWTYAASWDHAELSGSW